MQYLPVEFVLESSAIFAGIVFAVVALFGVVYYSTDIQYRRWAVSHLAFWLAFLPTNILAFVPYLGDFISCLLRIYASILLLRAFNFRWLSKMTNVIVHPVVFFMILLYWIMISSLSLPPTFGAIPTSILMAYTFGFVSKEILTNQKDRTKIWLSAGLSYLLWALASVPMTFLPLIPGVILTGYVQFIAQALVMITMFLSFIGASKRKSEEYLRLTSIYSRLITHDMRNYLLMARSAIELAEGADEESEEMLETADKSLDAAADFMSRTRNIWLSPENGTRHIDDLDLDRLISDVITRSLSAHSLPSETIEYSNSPDCYVSSTPLLSQVIWNIIDNSIQHSKGEPRISIQVSKKEKVVVHITDESGGIRDNVKESILSHNGRNEGMGLGLHLIREISEMYGIDLLVDDNIENGETIGTTFSLRIPYSGGVPSRID